MNSEISALQVALDAALQATFPPPSRVALIGMPRSHNVGDHALWVAQNLWLRRAGYEIVFAADRYSYSDDALARSHPDVIIFAGGGNLGDLWPAEQLLREHILESFPWVPARIFPQTAYFQQADVERRARESAQRHPDFAILVRDRVSHERLSGWDVRVSLSPDVAFALGPLEAPDPSNDIVLLLRQDRESASRRTDSSDDWIRTPRSLGNRGLRLSARLARRAPFLSNSHGVASTAWSHREVQRGMALLSRGHTVVSDRLHGHILALLMGRRSILLDNSYGKNRATYDTWTSGIPGAYFARSSADALTLVRDLASTGEEE